MSFSELKQILGFLTTLICAARKLSILNVPGYSKVSSQIEELSLYLPSPKTNALLELMFQRPLMVHTLFASVKRFLISFQSLDLTWTPKIMEFIRHLSLRVKTKTWPRMPNEKDRQNLPKDIIL